MFCFGHRYVQGRHIADPRLRARVRDDGAHVDFGERRAMKCVYRETPGSYDPGVSFWRKNE